MQFFLDDGSYVTSEYSFTVSTKNSCDLRLMSSFFTTRATLLHFCEPFGCDYLTDPLDL